MDIKPPKDPAKDFGKRYAHELKASSAAPKTSGSAANASHGESWRSVLATLMLLPLALGTAFLIAAFGLQSYQVDGQSMETTLQNRDRLIVDKIPRSWARLTHHAYIPKRGDIIVFNEPGLFDANGLAEKQLIKRVIGLPGDHIVVKNNKITIYNTQHPNGFNPDTTVGYKINVPTPQEQYSDVTLQPGQIFVCGDNRPNSEDSRYFGPIEANQIVGQLVLRLIPLKNIETF